MCSSLFHMESWKVKRDITKSMKLLHPCRVSDKGLGRGGPVLWVGTEAKQSRYLTAWLLAVSQIWLACFCFKTFALAVILAWNSLLLSRLPHFFQLSFKGHFLFSEWSWLWLSYFKMQLTFYFKTSWFSPVTLITF